jgi:hypothetical protein
MRLISREQHLTAEDSTLVDEVERRQLTAEDINEKEALKMFKELPWCHVLISPRFWWFRQ